jgi:hypothetical protein
MKCPSKYVEDEIEYIEANVGQTVKLEYTE